MSAGTAREWEPNLVGARRLPCTLMGKVNIYIYKKPIIFTKNQL